MILTKDQKNTLKTFNRFLGMDNNKYMIIQGAAGCGKSTLIPYLFETLENYVKLNKLLLGKNPENHKFDILVTATTNKAAAVLTELTGIDARTIHSLLRLKVVPDFQTGKVKLQKNKDYDIIWNKLIIIDEASMLNDELFRVLDDTVQGSKIVLMGDQYQLAPVKQKLSIMDTLQCTRVVLDKVMRHGGNIMHTGAQFRNTVETGVFQEIPLHNNVQHVDGDTFQKLINQAFTDKKYSSDTAKVLAWTNGRVQAYNEHIRKVKGLPELVDIGEKVITNNPIITPKRMIPVDTMVEITDVGCEYSIDNVVGHDIEIDHKIRSFMPNNPWDTKQLLKFLAKNKQWVDYYRVKEYWFDLRPVYASTVHKAQGSSYDNVFIDLDDIGRCNISSDVARMLYVAISRAVKQVILYGSLPLRYRGELAA